ncbi:45011_t:CDS:2 [Gigaspora margarita]|uniref:45011_t:CDS:1 n=1 Tax=Gigaspora margarita TaxID=4874 RepID=A0ABN7V126_GIGMA|nr:45011_t:CDS:2 [Gigaspora margarita]
MINLYFEEIRQRQAVSQLAAKRKLTSSFPARYRFLQSLLMAVLFRKDTFVSVILLAVRIRLTFATYRGEVDEDFWGRILRIDRVFGSDGDTYISGWLMNFFAYSGDYRVEIEDIPDGIAGVPFTLDVQELKFIAGFIGQPILDPIIIALESNLNMKSPPCYRDETQPPRKEFRAYPSHDA